MKVNLTGIRRHIHSDVNDLVSFHNILIWFSENLVIWEMKYTKIFDFYTKHFEISLTLLWDSIIIVTLAKLETNLRIYTKITQYLMLVYILQRSQKYLNSQLSIILMNLDIQYKMQGNIYLNNFYVLVLDLRSYRRWIL